MISAELQADLRARFNPDGSDLRRHQMRMLEMLKYIDRICRENDITYWLSSGTCLGAVRHGGFIPWDDDVDIEMLEPDYKRLLEILGTEPRDGYVLQDRRNEPTYIPLWAKFRDLYSVADESHYSISNYKYNGAFIDCFYLKPSNSYKIHRIAATIERLTYAPCVTFSSLTRFCNKIFKIVKHTFFPLLNVLDGVNQKNIYRHPIGNQFCKHRKKSDIFPPQYIQFEDIKLPIPGNVHNYLSTLFGDYTELPNIDNIKPHLCNILICPRQ